MDEMPSNNHLLNEDHSSSMLHIEINKKPLPSLNNNQRLHSETAMQNTKMGTTE